MGSLGTVIDRLSGLLSKYFLVGSYFPVLLALAGSFGMWCAISPVPRRLAAGDAWQKGLTGASALAGAAVLAYLLSTLQGALRRQLEKPSFLGRTLIDEMIQSQSLRREKKQQDLRLMQAHLTELRGRKEAWIRRLNEARTIGIGLNPRPANAYAGELQKLRELTAARTAGKLIAPDQIESAVAALIQELKKYPADEPDPADPQKQSPKAKKMDDDLGALAGLIDIAARHVDTEAVTRQNELQLNFALDEVAPTGMGNIALSVQDYFFNRYGMNFNFFWTRTQKLLGEEKFFSFLQETKAQLDFHVAMFWLSILFALVWTPVMAWSGYSRWLLAVVALGAPLAARAFYELAVESYRAYADLLRTTVDVYHFEFLKSLHIPLPASLKDERQTWKALNQWLLLGDYREILYKHPAP